MEKTRFRGDFLYNTTVITNKPVSNFGYYEITYNKNRVLTSFNYALNQENNMLKEEHRELESYNYMFFNKTLASPKVNYFDWS